MVLSKLLCTSNSVLDGCYGIDRWLLGPCYALISACLYAATTVSLFKSVLMQCSSSFYNWLLAGSVSSEHVTVNAEKRKLNLCKQGKKGKVLHKEGST